MPPQLPPEAPLITKPPVLLTGSYTRTPAVLPLVGAERLTVHFDPGHDRAARVDGHSRTAHRLSRAVVVGESVLKIVNAVLKTTLPPPSNKTWPHHFPGESVIVDDELYVVVAEHEPECRRIRRQIRAARDRRARIGCRDRGARCRGGERLAIEGNRRHSRYSRLKQRRSCLRR